MGNQLKTLMSTPDIVCYTKDFIIIEADQIEVPLYLMLFYP